MRKKPVLSEIERERKALHVLISDLWSVMDPEQYPDLNERILVVLGSCNDGKCVSHLAR